MRAKLSVVTCLLVAAFLLASCAPTTPAPIPTPTAPTTPTATAAPTTPTRATSPATPTKPVTGQPKYGGTINIAWPMDTTDWDQGYRSGWEAWALDLYLDKFAGQDWAKGPSGTGELRMQDSGWYPAKYIAGLAIEKWEYPDPLTAIYYVRKGIKFQNKPPVNGREMTANDVAVSLKRMWELPTAWMYSERVKVASVTATDKYSVTVKFKQYDAGMEKRILDCTYVVAADLVRDSSGKETEAMRNWKNAIGTGPWMMTDYVPSSSLSFVRNPDYWQRDPLHTENQLPYASGIKIKIIPEMATRLAALRTGGIEYLRDVTFDQVDSVTASNPELGKKSDPGQGPLRFFVRNDIKPFSDLKVRQALSMAVDRDMFVRDLYQGHAMRWMGWLHPFNVGLAVSEDELTPEGKATLVYNPTKAKELLAAAGYPNGFNTEILTESRFTNEAVLVADFLKKVGVNAKIDVKEFALYASIGLAKSYAGIYGYQYQNYSPYSQGDLYFTGYYRNYSVVSDKKWDDMRAKVLSTLEEAPRVATMREMGKYSAEQAWDISLPSPESFTYWQPWLKNFNGAYNMGTYGYFRPFTYVWIDKSK